MSAVIQADGLSCRFGTFVAVDRIALAVQSGEVFGLLGANGAGKTTAIRMLCGMQAPTAGRIAVAGIDMVHRAGQARGRIGYVAQRFSLYDDLTVRENLKLQAGLYGVRGPRRQERLNWALDRLTLNGVEDILAGNLPLGYKRRLALAAALLHEPRVLFLDEPTSGVDPLARQQFWELIYNLADNGIAILVTTHYMDEAQFCDRLVLMQAGRIVLEGTPLDVLKRPLATPLVELVTPAYVACVPWLRDRPEVIEILPLAGRLRLRLKAGANMAAALSDIRESVSAAGLPVVSLQAVAPELEDVFVAVLEEAGVSGATGQKT